MQTKKCRQCNIDFIITKEDSDFYQKIAPEFEGKKYSIPFPEICPECREQKRIGFRNQNMLYKNKCYLCNEDKIFIFSPDKEYKYCCPDCFYSDKWDAVDQGRDFDFNRSFFEQFDELVKDAKVMGIFSVNAENSPYINMGSDSKNCYLCFGGHYNQDCYYNTYSVEGKDNIDNYWIWKSERLYECVDCVNCNNSTYLTSC